MPDRNKLCHALGNGLDSDRRLTFATPATASARMGVASGGAAIDGAPQQARGKQRGSSKSRTRECRLVRVIHIARQTREVDNLVTLGASARRARRHGVRGHRYRSATGAVPGMLLGPLARTEKDSKQTTTPRGTHRLRRGQVPRSAHTAPASPS